MKWLWRRGWQWKLYWIVAVMWVAAPIVKMQFHLFEADASGIALMVWMEVLHSLIVIGCLKLVLLASYEYPRYFEGRLRKWLLEIAETMPKHDARS